jgi:hypothetical protein
VPDYRLYRSDVLIGTLTGTDDDFPWHYGTCDPAPAFELVRPLFDRELELLNADRMDEWEVAWEAVAALGLRLEPVAAGADIEEFLLHIEGSRAWWRC